MSKHLESEPWKQQPPCNICNLQHAGYERAHTETDDRADYSANFPAVEPWCNHDAPYLKSGDACECGEIKP